MHASKDNERTQGALCRLAVAVALGFAVLLAGILVFNVVTEMQRARRANAAVDTIALSNILLDDLQRERSEAIYLIVAPTADMSDYARRGVATDGTIESLEASALLTGVSLSGNQRAILDHGADTLIRLSALREGVTARTVSAFEAAQGYTAVNDALIEDMAALFAAFSGEPTRIPAQFEALAKLHDRVALETAAGYSGFAIGEMPEGLHGVFTGARSAQARQRERYREISQGRETLDLDALLGMTDSPGLHEARAALQASAGGPAPDPLHREAWSQTMAPRVTDLSVARNRFAREQLEQLAAASHARLRGALVRAAIAMASLVLALFAVRYILMRRYASKPAPAGRTTAKA